MRPLHNTLIIAGIQFIYYKRTHWALYNKTGRSTCRWT